MICHRLFSRKKCGINRHTNHYKPSGSSSTLRQSRPAKERSRPIAESKTQHNIDLIFRAAAANRKIQEKYMNAGENQTKPTRFRSGSVFLVIQASRLSQRSAPGTAAAHGGNLRKKGVLGAHTAVRQQEDGRISKNTLFCVSRRATQFQQQPRQGGAAKEKGRHNIMSVQF